MAETPKKLRKRDILLFVVIIAAILALVVGVSWVVEHSSGNRAKEQLGGIQTQEESAETANPVQQETEPASETELEMTSEPETTPEPETESPATTPEPTTEATTTATTANSQTSAETIAPQVTTTEILDTGTQIKEDTGKPENAITKDEIEAELVDEDENMDDYAINGYNNNIKNILLLGIDKNDISPKQVCRIAGQSDVIMILSMNLKTKEYFIISVNRDLVAPVENFSKEGESYGFVNEQICLAYAYQDGSRKSGQNALQTLNYIFMNTIPFQGYIAAPMTIISTMADAVDGVPVLIEDDFTGVDDSLKMGEVVTLRGEQAERFIRARMYMKDNPTNDYRMTRQFAFGQSFINKAKQLSTKKLISIYEDVMDTLMCDMSKSEVTKWIATLHDFDFKGFYRLDGEYGEDVGGSKARYITTEEVMDLVADLYYKKS